MSIRGSHHTENPSEREAQVIHLIKEAVRNKQSISLNHLTQVTGMYPNGIRTCITYARKYGLLGYDFGIRQGMIFPRMYTPLVGGNGKAPEEVKVSPPKFHSAVAESYSKPDSDEPIEELLVRRREIWKQAQSDQQAHVIKHVLASSHLPIGVVFVGDPHLDDDGCAWDLLEKHVNLLSTQSGLYGVSIGDISNNWPGRLARLYNEQHTTRSETMKFIWWFFNSVKWLALVGGNHDDWSGARNLQEWMANQADVPYRMWNTRIQISFASVQNVYITLRHKMLGSSIWNNNHGAMRAAQLGSRDHLVVGGHYHQTGFSIIREPATGRIQHCMQVAGYKKIDEFVDQIQAEHRWITPSHVTIIQPQYPETDPRLLTTFLDVEEGAEYLKWLRDRKQNYC